MRIASVIALLALGVASLGAQDTSKLPFRNTALPMEERINDLIHRLSLEEKAEQLNHLNHGIARLGVPMWGGWNQTLHGVWSKEPTTLFPAPIAMGATWDPELVHSVAEAMSDEARALYNAHAEGPRGPMGLVYRSPVINLAAIRVGDASRRFSAKIHFLPGAWRWPTYAVSRATISRT